MELSYEQTSVLTKAEGMPIEEGHYIGAESDSDVQWSGFTCGPDAHVRPDRIYRIVPGEELSVDQALLCHGMHVPTEFELEHIKSGRLRYKWYKQCDEWGNTRFEYSDTDQYRVLEDPEDTNSLY
jgi:hypothetical protein